MVNLSSFVFYHARLTPERVALIFGDQRITYAALANRVNALAAYLHREGIGADDVVAVLMKNSCAFIEIAFAVSHVGAVLLPINFRLAAEEVRYIAGNAETKLVFADAEFEAQTEGLRTVFLDAAAQSDTGVLIKTAPDPVPAAPRKPEDLFRLMYTSGTTDRPKGVMHSSIGRAWSTWRRCR